MRRKLLVGILSSFLTVLTFSCYGLESQHLKLTDIQECKSKISVHCGQIPTGTFDSNGRLWIVFEQQRHLYVSFSDDFGKTFSNPLQVNIDPESIYTDGENRPKIALGGNGEIYISWTQKTAGRFTGNVRFSRSLNKGVSFSPVITINDDGRIDGHRFDGLLVDHQGVIYLIWLDKRDKSTAIAAKKPYTGAALYYAVSVDSGETFSINRKVMDSTCECCRIGLAQAKPAGAAVFWRHIFGANIRDHAFAVLGEKGVLLSPHRATRDNWNIDACPHHGPALVEANGDSHAVVWFTQGLSGKGIFFGRINSKSGELFGRVALTHKPGASHPDVGYLEEEGLLVVWKFFDGQKTVVKLVISVDGGKTWSKEKVIAETLEGSDHPFILGYKDSAFLSWHTENEGLRIELVQGE